MSIGIGATLREAREEQGRSLEDAAAHLRTRVSQLEALEEERFGDFGGEVYAKGFLRNYALELGLDPAPLLDIYRNEMGHDDGAGMPLPTRVGTPRRQRSTSPAWMAWVLVAVVVLAGIALLGTLDNGRTPDQASPDAPGGPPPAPAVPEPEDDDLEDGSTEPGVADEEPEQDGEDGAEAEPEPEPEPDIEGVDLLLALEADSWMRVIVDGSLVLEQTVSAGETLPFEADREIEIRFGNAGGVRANLNGEDLGSQGTSGEAVTLRYTPEGLEEA